MLCIIIILVDSNDMLQTSVTSNEYHYSPTHDSLVTLHAFIKRSSKGQNGNGEVAYWKIFEWAIHCNCPGLINNDNYFICTSIYSIFILFIQLHFQYFR